MIDADGVRIARRQFLQAILAAPLAGAAGAERTMQSPVKLQSFDYGGVRLLPSRFLSSYEATRNFYFALPEDDVVHGFRAQAGLAAPGSNLDGWCRENSGVVFGQWLSGMARMAKATNDDEMRQKSERLLHAWAEAFAARPQVDEHYYYDKMVCGLLDLYIYTQNTDALRLLRSVTETARKQLSQTRQLASRLDPQASEGKCSEWYTLSENLYRAYLATGDSLYKDFGDAWRYEAYWSKFLDTPTPTPLRVHAYSHVNSFSSAALTYQVTGDPRYLKIVRNAYTFIRNSQMFAAGGYGPGERLVGYGGELGRALELHADTAEIGCGTWSGFKLARYLMAYTGEAHYGDWTERLLYNGIGAALPMAAGGKTFYYADYRIGSGTKYYLWDHWPCCSGTYIQNVADYHNILYFRDAEGLYINLFVPSEVTWSQNDQMIRLTLNTKFPESDTVECLLNLDKPMTAAIRFRVPNWATSASVAVNGAPVSVAIEPGAWAAIQRTWSQGDRIEIRVPQTLRAEAVDKEHPDRVAIFYGPVLLVEDLRFNLGLQMPPGRHRTEDLAARLRPTEQPLHFVVVDPPRQVIRSGKFFPYYAAEENLPYRMYHDFSQSSRLVQEA